MITSAGEASNGLLTGLWRTLEQQTHVYVLIYKHSIPFIQDPASISQEDYGSEELVESCLVCFLDEEGSEMYRQTVIEISEEIHPSELTIGKMPLTDVFSMMEELQTISLNDYSCPMRVDVAQKMGEDSVIADILYSTLKTKH